jgi:hypothetical protein
MKKRFVFVMAVVFVLGVGAGVIGQEKIARASEKPKVVRERVATVTATVQAIDLANRIVTLKGPKGKVVDLKVGEQVKNLPQVKVGDLVVAKYYESIAVQVLKPGETGGAGAAGVVAAAKPGERPAGLVANQVTVTATIEDISPKKTYMTLKGPDGKSVDVKVRDPKNLEKVKVGDQVMITYTEALAISVEKAKK